MADSPDPAGYADRTGWGHEEMESHGMTLKEALQGSSFTLTGGRDGSGGTMAFWGRASEGGFDGREGTFSLDGDATTAFLGSDYARGKWLMGLALAQSDGEGDYRDDGIADRPESQTCPGDLEHCRDAVRAGDGSVETSLTALLPYASMQATDAIKVWGVLGIGSGEVRLKTEMGGDYRADTDWSMLAAGARGDLIAPPAGGGGLALAMTSDALWTRTGSDGTDQLASSDSDATRLRLGLEGSWRIVTAGGGEVVPRLEIGARHDGGDAETGAGIEAGGGLSWHQPQRGLSLDISGRTLVSHDDDDLEDRGFAASVAFDPAPSSGRGLSLNLRQETGGQAEGGLDALFRPETLADRAGGGTGDATR